MKKIAGGIDKPARLLLRGNDGQPTGCSWISDFLDRIVSLQWFAEEEAQRGRVIADSAHALLFLQQ